MSNPCYRALIVEGSTADAEEMCEMLSLTRGFRFEAEVARDLASASTRLDDGGIDVVVLSLSLSDSTGFATFSTVHARFPAVPIVVVSSIDEESIALDAVRNGAQDYLAKGQFDANLLSRSLRYAIERTALQESLRQSEERFRQLTENMDGVFWMHEINQGKLLYVSPAYEQIWERSRQSVYDRPDDWLDAIHPDDHKRVVTAFQEHGASGDFNEEYRIQCPDGSLRWIWDRGVAIRNSHGQIYRFARIAEDITQRRKLEKEVLEAAAHAQQRIGQDLHDTVGQELTGLSFMAGSLARKLTDQSIPEADLAQEMVSAATHALGEVRGAIRGLTPVEVDANGLKVALEQLAATVQQRIGIVCHFQCDRPAPVEDNDIATHLYRVVQEAINNAVKHAEAKSILVRLEVEDGHIMLQITDDGVGMRDSMDDDSGMGLRIMRYRANAIGATFDIQTKENIGTVVTCTLKQDLPHGEE